MTTPPPAAETARRNIHDFLSSELAYGRAKHEALVSADPAAPARFRELKASRMRKGLAPDAAEHARAGAAVVAKDGRLRLRVTPQDLDGVNAVLTRRPGEVVRASATALLIANAVEAVVQDGTGRTGIAGLPPRGYAIVTMDVGRLWTKAQASPNPQKMEMALLGAAQATRAAMADDVLRTRARAAQGRSR